MKSLILASSSPYRRQLLARLGLKFEQISPDVDEAPLADEPPRQLAGRLAMLKARAIQQPNATVIGSDQVLSLAGRVLGKPGAIDRAKRQLKACSGKTVQVYTGLALITDDQVHSHIDRTSVTFRQLDSAEVDRYLACEPALDCAGSFKAERLGISLFTAIESTDPTALIGLPLIKLSEMLRNQGWSLP